VEVLPRQVAHQLSLEILILSKTNLKELPVDIGNLSSLEEFSLGNALLEMLPCSLGHLSSLKKLWVCDCPELKSLPSYGTKFLRVHLPPDKFVSLDGLGLW